MSTQHTPARRELRADAEKDFLTAALRASVPAAAALLQGLVKTAKTKTEQQQQQEEEEQKQDDTTAAPSSLASSASFPWVCPACWKKAAVAIQKAVLKPTGQRAAGAKKPRKKRANN